jgi:hypothetical protein
MMAVTGHRTSQELSKYTRSANQKALANEAVSITDLATTGKSGSQFSPKLIDKKGEK